VDTFEKEEQIDIMALSKEMTNLNQQIIQHETEFWGLLDELAITDETRELIELQNEFLYRRNRNEPT